MARRGTRSSARRSAGARPASGGRSRQRTEVPQAPQPQRASSAAIATFLAVAAVLTSLPFWPLSMVLGVAAVLVAVPALRRGNGSRAALLAAAVVGALACALSAVGVYLALTR